MNAIPFALLPSDTREHSNKVLSLKQRAFTRHWSCWFLDLGLPDLLNYKKLIYVLHKLTSVWYAVTTTERDKDISLLTQDEESPGMLLTVLPHMGQPHTVKNYPAQNVNSAGADRLKCLSLLLPLWAHQLLLPNPLQVVEWCPCCSSQWQATPTQCHCSLWLESSSCRYPPGSFFSTFRPLPITLF